MLKWLAPVGATLALVSAAPPDRGPGLSLVPEVEPGAVVLVACGGPGAGSGAGSARLGTAFWIGPHRMLTAAHVTSHGRCAIGRTPPSPAEAGLEVVREDGVLDVAELRSPEPHPFLRVGCGGFRAGGAYRAIGFIAGHYRANLPWTATGLSDAASGQAEFAGEAEPGMSGGPVIDMGGRAVGVIDQRFPARSRSLEDTYLCHP